MKKNSKITGFTLIEILMVLVILSALFYMGMNYMQQKTQQERIDRMVLQTQQILTAGLSYFLVNTKWPVKTYGSGWNDVDTLQTDGFLPPKGTIGNPFGLPGAGAPPYPYNLTTDTAGNRLVVMAYVGKAPAAIPLAKVIASKLPMATDCENYKADTATCTPCSTDKKNCYVVSSVSIPGQNLNNATSVNYAGLFHSGACVKAPTCPLTTMKPMITVVPTGVTGIKPGSASCTDPDDLTTCSVTLDHISGYTAYATPPVTMVTDGAPIPQECTNIAGGVIKYYACMSSGTTTISAKKGDTYWRVCLSVSAGSSGQLTPVTNSEGLLMGTVMVMTRCVSDTENNQNSQFSVYHSW